MPLLLSPARVGGAKAAVGEGGGGPEKGCGSSAAQVEGLGAGKVRQLLLRMCVRFADADHCVMLLIHQV